MKKKIITIILIVACFVLSASIGVAASDRNITKKLGGNKGDTFSVDGKLNVSSLKVNGASQFRGAISNPSGDVVFGDNVRIDGYVYRGKVNDSQPFIVKDSMQVTGTLTVSGHEVPTKTTLSGTIDITQSGDQVTGYSYGTNCDTAPPTFPSSIQYHYKKIAVSGLSVAAIPDLKVSIKIDSTHRVGYYPDIDNSWIGATYSTTEGYIYLLYKMAAVLCNGTTTPTYYTTGEYQIIVVN